MARKHDQQPLFRKPAADTGVGDMVAMMLTLPQLLPPILGFTVVLHLHFNIEFSELRSY